MRRRSLAPSGTTTIEEGEDSGRRFIQTQAISQRPTHLVFLIVSCLLSKRWSSDLSAPRKRFSIEA
jgi:hypothetical protein